ncbi:histidine phosphatase family protein [Variovorax sp. J22R133]|uniref:histidine phosphatase family protein n=1 Tax=Variovorax brevis TaxID=3053503 RepID=UPI002576FD2D|nr:histidine phosphatase family protein [Variovorax sp. J22R133]MDM0113035.1 histidine phosphatase family protein [Variovorax sp. J22R133]
MQRRQWLGLAMLPFVGSRVHADPAAIGLLRAGACAVLLRHAQTTPGVGDPPEFKLGDCSTQRNLSDSGRAQSRRIGEWFAAQRLKPSAVRCSAWCRCIDTAQLAFGRHTPWPALNSMFNDRAQSPAANQLLRDALASIPSGTFEVWVTHQVNITSLTGEPTSMGEGVIVDATARVLAPARFAAS